MNRLRAVVSVLLIAFLMLLPVSLVWSQGKPNAAFAGAFAVAGKADDNGVVHFGSPISIFPGYDAYVYPVGPAGQERNRWGDYCAVVADPVDGTFWTSQEYTASRRGALLGSWGVAIQHLKASGVIVSIVPIGGVDAIFHLMDAEHPYAPPDPVLAAGRDEVAWMTNDIVSVFRKDTGILAGPNRSLNDFWRASLLNAGLGQKLEDQAFDPRIVYDPATDRWFASALDKYEGTKPTSAPEPIMVAVSTTRFAEGPWVACKFASTKKGDFVDFDGLGINQDGIFVAVINFNKGLHASNTVLAVPKTALMAKPPLKKLPAHTLFMDLKPDETGVIIQPVVDVDGQGHEMLLATKPGHQEDTLLVRELLFDAMTNSFTLLPDRAEIGMKAYAQAHYARQPLVPALDKLWLEADDLRLSSSVVRQQGFVWAVQTALPAGPNLLHPAPLVRWLQIVPGNNQLEAEGSIGLGSGPLKDTFNYFDAAIAVNADGAIVICFTGSNRELIGQ